MTSFQYGRRLIDDRRRYRRWIDPRVWSLPLAAVVEYLRKRRWKEVAPDRPQFLVFEEPHTPAGEEPCHQFVPTFEHEPGYGQQMFELLTGLAEFEDRQASEILDEMLKPAAGERQQPNGVPAGRTQDAGNVP